MTLSAYAWWIGSFVGNISAVGVNISVSVNDSSISGTISEIKSVTGVTKITTIVRPITVRIIYGVARSVGYSSPIGVTVFAAIVIITVSISISIATGSVAVAAVMTTVLIFSVVASIIMAVTIVMVSITIFVHIMTMTITVPIAVPIADSVSVTVIPIIIVGVGVRWAVNSIGRVPFTSYNITVFIFISTIRVMC